MPRFTRARLLVLLFIYISGFDTNTEAKLLNITVDSVRKKRLRLRQKLNIILPDNNATLYEYLIENMH